MSEPAMPDPVPDISFEEIQRRRRLAFACDDEPDEEAPAEFVGPPKPGAPLPGTPQKLELLRERALNRETVHQPPDVLHDPGRLPDARRSRNGSRKSAKKREVLAVSESEPGERPITIGMDSGSLGRRIKELRHARGTSQEDVETATGVSQTALSQLENGKRTQARLETLLALAEYFGVTIDYLVGRESKAG